MRDLLQRLRGMGAGNPGQIDVPRFSVVTAAHNVERYIDDYFKSLTTQTIGFRKNIEIVLVDDGSTDGTLAIAQDWARQYPENIRVVSKDHGGVASARNRGVEVVRGEWVTFVDSDDFVAKNYFAVVAKFIEGDASGCGLISCRSIIFDEASGKKQNTHPLDYRYRRGERTVDLLAEPDCFQMAVSSAFFRASDFRNTSMRFDERITSTFSDARFVGEFILRLAKFKIVFLPKAQYFYRKRSNQSSLVDKWWQKKAAYFERLNYGHLWLLEKSRELCGRPPDFLQHELLYDLSWYFAHSRESADTFGVLNEHESEQFEALFRRIFGLIDQTAIETFDEARLSAFDKVSILRRYKGVERSSPLAIAGPVDHRRQLVQLSYLDNHEVNWTVAVDGKPIEAAFKRRRERRFNSKPFGTERILWVPLRPGETIALMADGAPVALRVGSRAEPTWNYENILSQSVGDAKNIKLFRRALLRLSRLAPVRRRYRGAWIFMDRDTHADDNAEHLYRWVRSNASEGRRSYFILRRRSPDWNRLKREGFRLLPFGGIRHRLALLNADWILSSHADEYVWGFTHAPKYGHSKPPGFGFLQHGVVAHDLSEWFNAVPIDLMISTAPREAKAFLTGNYRFTDREVALTGLARHDRLMAMPSERRLVLVMPTWRIGWTRPSGRTNQRLTVPGFRESRYLDAWQTIVGDTSLVRDLNAHGYKLVFCLHTNMEQYLSEFDIAEGVVVLRQSNDSIQDAISRSALLVTDYSSVASDAALIGRPVIYLHIGGVSGRDEPNFLKGYFDYEHDGFGEVCRDAATLKSLIREYADNGCVLKPIYAARAEVFLPFKDTENCRRIYEAVLERS